VFEDAFVQVAGEADVEGAREARQDVDAVASALFRSHEGIGMLRLRKIVFQTILLRSA